MDLMFFWLTLFAESTWQLKELHKFPDSDCCHKLCGLNRNYLRHLESQAPVRPRDGDWFYEAQKETQLLYCAWAQLADARNEHLPLYYRLERIRIFRELVGDRVFFGADPMPPPLPLWRMPVK